MWTFSSASNITTEINSWNASNGSLIFDIDGSSQKSITSKDTCLTIFISDLISLYQKTVFKKVLYLASNIPNTYSTPKWNLIPKEILDVIHEHNMKRNWSIIKKEGDIFG